MKIGYIHFYVENASLWRWWFVRKMGFQSVASGKNRHTQTEVVQNGAVKFVLSSPLTQDSPVAEYLQQHPPGIADLAFVVENLERAIAKAIASGAKLLQPIQQRQFPQGSIKSSQILSIAGLRHTLTECDRQLGTGEWELGTGKMSTPDSQSTCFDYRVHSRESDRSYFTGIDHVVLNVAKGKLTETVDWYQRVFGFEPEQTFQIETDRSGLYSQVLIHPASGVKLPVNEPVSPNSQIQEFLDVNRGAGIQHIALQTPQIVKVTAKLRQAGVAFLEVPNSYYTELQQRHPELNLVADEWEAIAEQQILLDCQELGERHQRSPLLLQIFTQPIFPQPTFFFELIERRSQAKGFGEGNFRALFEAIEREQIKRGSLSLPSKH
ncbi:4-hydroxyphenylpyruvate dioxygenase [Oscillatoria salina]|uniref:4-hydroxyphenylpyruvate dioxygenase n=1 Tax=Oscillatoria salina TaxID=331517 RepID=UPI0013BD4A6E|nr:4-hydroxyphenylpyruvate dioxygenase [Oscillatoria salina]MBZ8180441.1 4-hydroxyphenylpyruvate dioxygenase [Oscillatoria salina IIICB1]NET89465.1 4-hydroxyphenylpyruvate dioxygenase [Kamptonema sp. SIO1D9]